jgi:hypothetical protein
VLEKLLFAIDRLEDTLTDFGTYERHRSDGKHVYGRDYSDAGMPSLRIVLEENGGDMEICSIHFKTLRKKK